MSDHLPLHLEMDALIRNVQSQGGHAYVVQKGDPHSGGVMIKLYNPQEKSCQLKTRFTDMDGKQQWMDVLDRPLVSEQEADAAIREAVQFDPDLWVIELEGQFLFAELMKDLHP